MISLFSKDPAKLKAVMDKFYEKIMSDSQLSNFFENKGHLKGVYQKQLEHFGNIHTLRHSQIIEVHQKLGRQHAKLGLNYSSLESALDFLFRIFLKEFVNNKQDAIQMEHLLSTVKEAVAYGYMQHEVEVFTDRLRLMNRYSSTTVNLKENLEWFMMLHSAILGSDEENLKVLLETSPVNEIIKCSAKDLNADLVKAVGDFQILQNNMFFNINNKDNKGTLSAYSHLKENFLYIIYLMSLAEQHNITESFSKDPLTGVLTRKQIQPLVSKASASSMISGKPFTICMTDIDHFKKVNDTYGHKAGDMVLQQFSKILTKHTESASAEVVRYGGEEFLILFPEMSCEQAADILEDVRLIIEMHPFNIDNQIIHITSSFGLSQKIPTPGQMTDPLEVIKLADEKLYEAKESGRNRIIF